MTNLLDAPFVARYYVTRSTELVGFFDGVTASVP